MEMLDWLAHRAEISPEHTALMYRGESWTYADLNRRVATMCARLAQVGIKAGDHVAVALPNGLEYVGLGHALARMGAVMVPLNVRLISSETIHQIKQSRVRHVIATRSTREAAEFWEGNPLLVEDLTEAVEFSDWLSRPLDLEAVQGIVFTSGTTGQPKGAMLAFANHLWSAQGSAYRLGTLPEDRWLACMPLYHMGGQAIIFRACLYGVPIVLHDGFDVERVSLALDEDRITMVSLVPTMLHRLMEYRGERPLPESVRCILIGGAAASKQIVDEALERGWPISLTYGLTEAASQVATATPEEVRRKPGSVGKPLMFSQVRIVDEDGVKLPSGEIGEIAISGPTVMRGYFDQPEATGNVLRDDWLHTGDLGYLDEDGDLWVVQRRSDLIVTGGENVYPAEVEAILEAHPGIAEACVVGIDDQEWGQRVGALIVRRDESLTEEAVIGYCRDHLAGYKIPHTIYFSYELPRTASGKIERSKATFMIEDRTFTGIARKV
jgi:O-succinylbenzoic acid--CoA ligase